MAGKPIARCFVDSFVCPKYPPGAMIIPAQPPVTRLVDGMPVARLGDIGVCLGGNGNLDVVMEGSATLRACGLPIARKGDAMLHGGVISSGSPTEEDGSGTWSLPKNLTVGGTNEFVGKVMCDLYFLSTTPTGQATLNAIAASGQQVTIVSGGYTMTTPDDLDAVKKGGKSSSRIDYDPNNMNIYTVGKDGCLASPPQLSLGHELIHAARFARGGATLSPDHEEKMVIGPPYGRKDKDPNWPTENGLRKDLGLGTRINDEKCKDTGKHPPCPNLRPGRCPP